MKKELFLTVLSICLFVCQQIFAQSYYQPEVDYVYRSKKAGSSDATSILAVRFNSSGVATIARSETASIETDKELFQVMAPLAEIATSTFSGGDGSGEVSIEGDTLKYWLVSFDNPSTARNGNTVTIWCDCKMGGTSCSVSFTLQGNNLNATCATDAGCSKCEMKTKSSSKGQIVAGGLLLIKAENVVIQ
ncbi:MAG: hypothetical protein KF734_06570 [Saprospiraceae bacterium]|nr:hypothetical protein [Saprospiraceae bacterium]